jgi:hypothetical protein
MKAKGILVLVLGIIIASFSFGQEVKNDLENFSLCGMVKSSKESTYEAIVESGEITKGRSKNGIFDNLILYFDKQGKLTECYSYNSDGSLSLQISSNYDDRGNMIEFEMNDSYDSLFYKMTYNYNDDGKLIELNTFDSIDRLYSNAIYTYDDNGNLIEDNVCNADGSLEDKSTYKYSDDGKIVEEFHINLTHKIYRLDI